MANGIGSYTPLLLLPLRRQALIAGAHQPVQSNADGWAVLAGLAVLTVAWLWHRRRR